VPHEVHSQSEKYVPCSPAVRNLSSQACEFRKIRLSAKSLDHNKLCYSSVKPTTNSWM